jgi:hypothetical protein
MLLINIPTLKVFYDSPDIDDVDNWWDDSHIDEHVSLIVNQAAFAYDLMN